jgi:hypothetical protein
LPDQGFRRGAVIGFAGAGSTSLFLAALVPAVRDGSWLGVVGMPALGIEAASGIGLSLDRLVLVPDPGRRWAEVVAALIDAVDLVVAGATTGVRSGDARRLAARVRERHGLLVVAGAWPEPMDLRLEVTEAAWSGLEAGDGILCHRKAAVTVIGRRAAARPRTTRVLLPAEDGRLGLPASVEARPGLAASVDAPLGLAASVDARVVVDQPLRALAG